MSPIAAITLGAVPAGCMLLFTFVGLGIQVQPSVAGALQHFAAGVLLCTIGTELLPAMVNATGWGENLSCAVGFFTAVALLIAIGALLPETGDHDEEEGEDKLAGEDAAAATEMLPSPRQAAAQRPRQRQSLKAAAYHAQETAAASSVPSTTTAPAVAASEEQPLVPSKSRTIKPFPTALLLAVAVDSALDGLLIGIAIAAGPSAGPMMSASLSIEMGFLGLTLATALHVHSPSKSLPAAALGPAALVAGAAVGGFMASALGDDPVLFAGMLSFGTSALLFMVAEELLLEAHDDGEHVWWVDLQLYTGFFVSVMAGKLVPGDGA